MRSRCVRRRRPASSDSPATALLRPARSPTWSSSTTTFPWCKPTSRGSWSTRGAREGSRSGIRDPGSGTSITCVFGKRGGCFPHLDAHDGKPLLRRLVEDQPRDAFDRGIAVNDKHRLAQVAQRFDQRIVVAQQHLVIELAIDPPLHDPLNIAEVAYHVPLVELTGAHFDFSDRVVPVRVLADAVVVEQAVAVAER